MLYKSWIRPQQEYHQDTSARYRRRSAVFVAISVSLFAARNLDGIQQATLAISRSMRDEATDWYSAVHTQEIELPA